MSVDASKLVGKIYEKGFSQAKIAKELGIVPRTFYAKARKGVFESDEIEKICQLLEIVELTEMKSIFFPNLVTRQETKPPIQEPIN